MGGARVELGLVAGVSFFCIGALLSSNHKKKQLFICLCGRHGVARIVCFFVFSAKEMISFAEDTAKKMEKN